MRAIAPTGSRSSPTPAGCAANSRASRDFQSIRSASDTLIVTDRRRYARSGDTISVSGDGLPYRLRRCGA